YSAADKRLLQEMTTPVALSDVSFLENGTAVAGAASDKQIYVFNDSLVRLFSGHEGAVVDAEFLADGARLITAGADKTVRLWNVADGKELARFTGQSEAVSALSIAGSERQ